MRIRKAVNPPGNARTDTSILLEIAKRLGAEKHFTYNSSEEIFNELRVASKGGTADYFGITYKKIEDNMGVFWPCPSEDHPGTPRLWEDRKFKTPDGRAHFHGVAYRDPAEMTDAEYPMILTTGRVVSQYLSGTQTRRIGKAGGPISRAVAGDSSENGRSLWHQRTRTGPSLDPARVRRVSRATGGDDPRRHGFYSVSLAGPKIGQPADVRSPRSGFQDSRIQGLRLPAGTAGTSRAVRRRNQSLRQRMNTTTFRTDLEFFFDPQRCIGCHACEMACAECETNGQTSMIHVDYVDRF